jgi:hypothetical protein
MSKRVMTVLCTVIGIALAGSALAQIHDPRALEADPEVAPEAIAPVLDGLGDEGMTITTDSPRAQEFFNQGLRLTYGFNHSEALRAFKESARLDLENPMAYWGWALVLGPNLNLPMQAEVEDQAYRAMQNALSLKDRGTEKEQAYIDALATRYSDDEEAERKELNIAYSQAMKALHEAYPEDNDAATLYAASLMNLSPWNYWMKDGSPRENTPEILAVLEQAIERDNGHTGAIHYYIHLVEEKHPEKAERAAELLAPLAPKAGHLVHMPAHIYMRLGRYADSYDTNAKAVQADENYITSCRAQGIYPLGYYPHNIHFMVWSAMFQGRSVETLELARKVAAKIPDHIDEKNWSAYELFRSQPFYAMVRFGMWDEVLAEPKPIERSQYMTGIWHYARALAYLHEGNRRSARREWKSLDKIREVTPDTAVRRGSYGTLMLIASEIVQAELAAEKGDYSEALLRLERGVRLQDGLDYAEPPAWYFPVRHLLGAVLIEAGYPEEAEVVYWADLRDHPDNGYALFGLVQSLRAQGKDDQADEADERFKRAWESADVQLTTSRY